MGILRPIGSFILKAAIYGCVAIVVLTLAVRGVMSFADGPWEIVPGGPFTTGEAASFPEDRSFLHDVDEVQFQLLSTGSSRTAWIAEHNNRLFIPSGYMNTTYGKIWKQWPKHAEKDGAAILRVDDKLYTLNLKRILVDPDLEEVLAELSRKYSSGGPTQLSRVADGDLWIFELIPT